MLQHFILNSFADSNYISYKETTFFSALQSSLSKIFSLEGQQKKSMKIMRKEKIYEGKEIKNFWGISFDDDSKVCMSIISITAWDEDIF